MAAINSIVVKWLGTGLTLSFTNALGEQNWAYLDDTLLDTGDYPGTGSTLNFLDSGVPPPASNLPNAGEVFDIVLRDEEGSGWDTAPLTAFLGAGSWNYSSLTIGDASHHNDRIFPDKDSTVAGTITVWGICEAQIAHPNALITIKNGGYFETTNELLSQSFVVEAGGILDVTDGLTSPFASEIRLAGNLTAALGPGAILDCSVPILITASTATIDWANLTIKGGLNANGFTVTHLNTTGASLVCDVAGDLDLGGSAPGLTVSTSGLAGTVTSQRGETVHALALAAGTFDLNKKTWIVGAGRIRGTGGTLLATAARIGFSSDIILANLVVGLASAVLVAQATGKTINGADATITGIPDIFANGHALTVANFGTAAARCWNNCTPSGTNTNVQFLPGPPDEY